MTAQAYREQALALRRAMHKDIREKKSTHIAGELKRIIGDAEDALSLLCYYPLADEVSLLPLYETWLVGGRRLYFPVTREDVITFYQVHDMRDFAEGSYHVMEPLEREKIFLKDEEYIAIVPGVAFDETGARIGFGRGCYDRFFAEHPQGRRIGVCFSEQLFHELPQGKHDVKMHEVLWA